MQEAHRLHVLLYFHDTEVMDRLLLVLEAPPTGTNIEDREPIELERTRDDGPG